MNNDLKIFSLLEYRYDSDKNLNSRVSDLAMLIRLRAIALRWKNYSFDEKEIERRNYLGSLLKRQDKLNALYYNKMIDMYEIISKKIDYIEKNIFSFQGINDLSTNVLSFFALLLIERDYIDEFLIPKHHLHPDFFYSMNNMIELEYPDLSLSEFNVLYEEMYTLWKNCKI